MSEENQTKKKEEKLEAEFIIPADVGDAGGAIDEDGWFRFTPKVKKKEDRR